MSFLEQAWEQREEEVYKELFGDLGEGIYLLSPEMFKNQFNCENVDPRWLHYGVFKSPPNEKRNTWLYVSSGMSNPWETEEKEEYSGFGTEFILETETDESWGIQLVQSLIAFNIMLSIGKYGDKPLLDYGDRIPQNIEPNITHIVLWHPESHPETVELLSGKVDFLQITGITQEEFEFAKEHGSEAICEKLRKAGHFSKVNPKRTTSKNA